MDLNRTYFHVGIVKNTESEFKIKVGLTKELCDISRTLGFGKQPPFAFKCNYKSLTLFQNEILQFLEQNEWQNFGVAEQPDDVIYSMQHIFTLYQPKLPLTRL